MLPIPCSATELLTVLLNVVLLDSRLPSPSPPTLAESRESFMLCCILAFCSLSFSSLLVCLSGAGCSSQVPPVTVNKCNGHMKKI